MRVLITGACGVTSRAVARSLRLSRAFRNLYLVGTDICENPFGLFEGLLDRIYRVPRVGEPDYHAHIERICRDENVDAAIVIPELEVLYWSTRNFPVPALLPPGGFCQISVSKRRLYELLEGTGLVPRFRILARAKLVALNKEDAPTFPCWIRDFSEGTSSGKGAFLAHSAEESRAWAMLNPGIEQFMVADYLPGRNFACHLLYDRGRIAKIACYERMEYFMARTSISGVTGNISKGRLMNDGRLVSTAKSAIARILAESGETMRGLVAVDFRESTDGRPMITEINLRHVAATYAFAAAGFNLAEAHLLVTLGKGAELGDKEAMYPPQNVIFRDIDGIPIWLDTYTKLAIGEFVGRE